MKKYNEKYKKNEKVFKKDCLIWYYSQQNINYVRYFDYNNIISNFFEMKIRKLNCLR